MIEYFSESNGSKNTLVIPTDASRPACEFKLREPPLTLWFTICLVITKLEFEVFTSEIICLGNFANIPESSRFKKSFLRCEQKKKILDN